MNPPPLGALCPPSWAAARFEHRSLTTQCHLSCAVSVVRCWHSSLTWGWQTRWRTTSRRPTVRIIKNWLQPQRDVCYTNRSRSNICMRFLSRQVQMPLIQYMWWLNINIHATCAIFKNSMTAISTFLSLEVVFSATANTSVLIHRFFPHSLFMLVKKCSYFLLNEGSKCTRNEN